MATIIWRDGEVEEVTEPICYCEECGDDVWANDDVVVFGSSEVYHIDCLINRAKPACKAIDFDIFNKD